MPALFPPAWNVGSAIPPWKFYFFGATTSKKYIHGRYGSKNNPYLCPLFMGRILAIDYGQKRVGLAVTDPLRIVANGLDTIAAKEALDYLKKYIGREPVDKIIVGFPTQMNGKESESMKYIRPFVGKLRQTFPGMEIAYVDERFTSVLAHKAMLDGGLKKKDRQNKALVDKMSAVIILQTYMESPTINLKL